jgi:hypothetical protein
MAPLAKTHEIANGIDFNLNVMNTSPSRISQSGFLRSPHAGSALARGACKGFWPGAFKLLVATH